jgi:predicted transcriptional regulator
MEPKATADKKLNSNDLNVMDVLRNGPVIDIADIKDEIEVENLSKTIASLKKKGILAATPGDKNTLTLTELGAEKVAIVQAGMDKERREAEERAAARSVEAEANIAAREAAKTPEQRDQEKLQQAQLDARNAARAQREEASKLFRETNLNRSDKNAIQLIDDDMFDDPSELREGSTFDKSMFEDSLTDMYDGEDLPEGETASSLVSKTITSLQKKGILTTAPGDKSKLALTEQGAQRLNEYRTSEPSEPTSDATGPNLDEKNAMFRDFDDSESGDESSKQVKVLSEESDSDFDDVEVDTSYLRKAAAPSPTTDAVDEALAPFVDTYGLALDSADTMSLAQVTDNVNKAAAELRSNPSAETNKKYKESLQAFLNHRAYMIQRAHEDFIIPGDMKKDWELTADSLLSVSELKLINAAIKPSRALVGGIPGTQARKFSPKVNRKNAPNWKDILTTAGELDQINKDNPIKDLAPNWEVQSFVEKLVAGESDLLDENGAPKSGLRAGVSSHLVKLLSRAIVADELKDFLTPGTVQLRDSSGVYVGNLTINSGYTKGKRYATDEEINASLDSIMDAGGRLHLPGTAGSVAAGDVLGDKGMNIFITSSDRELSAVVKKFGREGKALAYATPFFGITVFVDRVRSSKSDFDRGSSKQEGTPMDWWSSKINPNTMETWDHTMKHEIGHMVDARGNTLSNSKDFGNIGSPSRYGRKDSKEKFAELFAKYMRGEPVSDTFMAILRAKGLLKSQGNN